MAENDRSSLETFIFLYGPPGSGKSACGHALAADLGLPFYDLDREIETGAGMAIPEIFALQGEAGFRERERAALAAVLARPAGVVALGGGALLDPGNRRAAEGAGRVLCLDAPLETLLARLATDPLERPLLAGQSAQKGSPDMEARLAQLLSTRAEHYASFPDRLEVAGRTIAEVAWEAQVQLGRFRVRGMGSGYDVRVANGALASIGPAAREREIGGPVALVSDDTVWALYGDRVGTSLQEAGFAVYPVQIPAGERYKTVETAMRLWEAFVSAGLERGSTVVALGGGVIGDLAGFAAATFLRGLPWVAAPTSLLAMVDASLGGKTGADLPQGKNLVGAFHAPRLVLADPLALQTLPEDELRAGLAEVVKAGLIADPQLFARCAQGWQALVADWGAVIRPAMGVKIRVIQADPFEGGARAALNLGHTIGHALELASGYGLRHGEAVATGLCVEARLAEHLGLAKAGLAEQVEAVLRGLGLPTRIPSGLSLEAIRAGMRVDKKRFAGRVRFALPVEVGQVKTGVEVDEREVAAVLGSIGEC